jgi:hypothetical protein
LSDTKKILIVGPVLPPLGGISVHIDRLYKLLKFDYKIDFIDDSKNVKTGIYNFRRNSIKIYFKKILNSDILFIHSGSKLLKTIHIVVGKLLLKKIVITIHGYGNKRNYILKAIDSLIYNFSNKIIIVNSSIYKKIILKRKKCVLQNAYLPPNIDDEPQLPDSVLNLLENSRLNNEIVISANASNLSYFNHEDLYGLDMCVELSKYLVSKNHSILFIFFLSSFSDGNPLYSSALQKIKDYNLQSKFIIIIGYHSFVRLIIYSDIIVRPTNIDGDSLSVRESLLFNKITIASDAVERPKEVVLFSNRDQNDFNIKVELSCKKITDSVFEKKYNDINLIVENQKKFYRKIYKNILDEV